MFMSEETLVGTPKNNFLGERRLCAKVRRFAVANQVRFAVANQVTGTISRAGSEDH